MYRAIPTHWYIVTTEGVQGRNVLSWGNFVCNVPTNIFNILTPAVFMSPTTLSQTRLVKDIFKLIGKSLHLYDFLTYCISYAVFCLKKKKIPSPLCYSRRNTHL